MTWYGVDKGDVAYYCVADHDAERIDHCHYADRAYPLFVGYSLSHSSFFLEPGLI